MSRLWIWMAEQLFKVDTFRKEFIIFFFFFCAATHEQGSEIILLPQKPEECLWQRRISQPQQLYGTLSAKDGLLLHWGDDALHFTASSDVGWDGSWILIRKAIKCFSGLCTNSRTTAVGTFIFHPLLWDSLAAFTCALFPDIIHFFIVREHTAELLEMALRVQ